MIWGVLQEHRGPYLPLQSPALAEANLASRASNLDPEGYGGDAVLSKGTLRNIRTMALAPSGGRPTSDLRNYL